MNFKENPFHLLGVSLYDGKDVIEERTEDKCFDDQLNEEIYEKSRGILEHPSKRLEAELGWFLGANREQEKDIVHAVENGNYISVMEVSSLSQMNSLLYMLNTDDFIKTVLKIDSLYKEILPDNLLDMINKARQKSHITQLQDKNILLQYWRQVRQNIHEQLKNVVSELSQDTYVKLANKMVDCICKDALCGVVINDFFATYTLDLNPYFFKQQEKVDELLQLIFDNPNDSQILQLDDILSMLAEAARPIALRAESIGSEKIGQALYTYSSVRSVGIDLYNEKNDTVHSLALCKLLKKHFAYLTSYQEKLNEDIIFLEDKLKEPAMSDVAKQAIDALKEILDDMSRKLHFEEGYSLSNLDFYNNEFKKSYHKIMIELSERRGYSNSEHEIVHFLIARCYMVMAQALTWADRFDLAHELGKSANEHAKFSHDNEIMEIIDKLLKNTGQAIQQGANNNYNNNDTSNKADNKLSKRIVALIGICFVAVLLSSSYNHKSSNYTQPSMSSNTTTKTTLTTKNESGKVKKNKPTRERKNNCFLGNVAIGDDKSMVHKMLGNENRQESRNGNATAYIYDDCTVVFDDRGFVIGLESNSNQVTTTLGINEGTGLRTIQEKYGVPYAKSQYGDLNLYEYKIVAANNQSCILRFALNSMDVVDYISIRVDDIEEPANIVQDVRTKKEIATEAAQILFQYHEAITDRNYRNAYSYTSDKWQNRVSYDGWAQGFKTTISSDVSKVSYEYATEDKVVLNYILTARDNPGGTRRFKGKAVLVRNGAEWKIENMEHKKIN